jgi:hypothetical protein
MSEATAAVPVDANERWGKRLSTWRGLWDELNRHPYGRMLPQAPGHDEAQADQEALCDLCSAGERLLMLTPAPDASALLDKMDVWWTGRCSLDEDEKRAFAAIRADVARLTGAPTV